MAKQTANYGRRWYTIHTYSGFEENVKKNLEQRIDSMDMHDRIFNVVIPKEKKIKIKAGKRKVVEEKIYPGYVMIEMVVTDESWYVVRNTPSVTGFIGSGVTPSPLSEEEVLELQKRMGVAEPEYTIDVQINDIVRIIDGPFKNSEGKVSEIDDSRGKIKILVNMFGGETPIELDFLQVQKV